MQCSAVQQGTQWGAASRLESGVFRVSMSWVSPYQLFNMLMMQPEARHLPTSVSLPPPPPTCAASMAVAGRAMT